MKTFSTSPICGVFLFFKDSYFYYKINYNKYTSIQDRATRLFLCFVKNKKNPLITSGLFNLNSGVLSKIKTVAGKSLLFSIEIDVNFYRLTNTKIGQRYRDGKITADSYTFKNLKIF